MCHILIFQSDKNKDPTARNIPRETEVTEVTEVIKPADNVLLLFKISSSSQDKTAASTPVEKAASTPVKKAASTPVKKAASTPVVDDKEKTPAGTVLLSSYDYLLY